MGDAIESPFDFNAHMTLKRNGQKGVVYLIPF